MARSPWNAALEQALSIAAERKLSGSALRLYLVLLRYTLGWNRRTAQVGRRLLCEKSGLHGRTFERARSELVEAGLVRVEHGANEGPNTRSTYSLTFIDLVDLVAPGDTSAGGQFVQALPVAAEDDRFF